MKRRSLLGLVAVVASAPLQVHSHTPYQQWMVYRKKHLLIGCHREDLRTWELAKEVTGVLDKELPDARARIARAKTRGRLASLLGTEQLQTALLSPETAGNMVDGRNGFEPYGEIALKTLAVVEKHVLVCRADFPKRHAWQLAHALQGKYQLNQRYLPQDVPMHPGALAMHDGQAIPDY